MRWLWLSLALAACGTASEGVSSSTSPVLGAEESGDGGASPDAAAPPIGALPSIDETPIVLGGPAHRVTYSPDAPFTAIAFTATAGQEIGFLVDSRTAGAKPAVWITDNHFVSIAQRNTGAGSVFVRFTAERTGIHYLVLREVALQPSTFLIRSFAFAPRPPPPPPPPPADEDAGAE